MSILGIVKHEAETSFARSSVFPMLKSLYGDSDLTVFDEVAC